MRGFIKGIKRFIINFFGNIRVYKGGFVLFGQSKYKLKGPDWREILDIIQPGDIIGVAHHNYVSSWFIKGDFSHVGLYVGDNTVIHVRAEGILKEDILTFLRADDAFVVRPADRAVVDTAIQKAYEQLNKGAKYDFDFDALCDEEFYCSEFTDYCTDYMLRESVSKNNKYIYPDDYLIPSDKFEIIWKKSN